MKVCCVFVQANVPFTPDYVTRLQSMVRRNLRRPHDFYCLTDRPHLLPDINTIRIPDANGLPGWWSKIELFNRRHGLRGPALYLDLDVLVPRELDPVVDFPAPLALIPHAGDWNGRNGLSVVRRYNSSVIKFEDIGAHGDIYSRWSPGVAHRLWGDQDWIGEQRPDEAVMPIEWFPRLSQLNGGPTKESRVVLCKKPKNHEAAKKFQWIREMWQ